MNWVDVASNQCFSCDTLQNAVDNSYFILKNTIPTSSKMVTTSEAENYVYIDAISKSSNQLPVKSDMISNPPYATVIISNSSLDLYVYLSDIDVNGVALINTIGPSPINTGDSGSGQTDQLGVYDIAIGVYCGTPGQRVELTDSASITYCNNITSTGLTITYFYSVVINNTTDININLYDGTCP